MPDSAGLQLPTPRNPDEEGSSSSEEDGEGGDGAVAVSMQSGGNRRSWLQRLGGRRVNGAGAAANTRGAVSTGAVTVEMVGLDGADDARGWSTDEGVVDERSALARQ